jgi:hypothetical protein
MSKRDLGFEQREQQIDMAGEAHLALNTSVDSRLFA